MNVAQMLLMLQLQQMDTAWQSALSGQAGPSALTGTNNDANSLLFASLLEAALGGGTSPAFPGMTDSLQGSNSLTQSNSANGDNDANTALSASSLQTGLKSASVDTIDNVINTTAQKYGVNPALIQQIVNAESGFNANATSQAGAMGLMQLMPGTAASYGVQNAYDAAQNLDGGTHFLKDLLTRFQGNIPLSLAAYNAGPGAVEKYNGIPPYKETQAYVQRIMAGLNQNDWKV